MAKVSGLMSSGKIGKPDQKVVDAMPDAPAAATLESSAAVEFTPETPALESSTAVEFTPETLALESSTAVEFTPETLALESSTAVEFTPETPALDSSAHVAAVTELAVALIRPSPFQVRAVADSDYIETLMASIVQSGVISPVVVRMLDSSNYEMIAGHHRLEACRRLGHVNVPVVVRHMTDSEAACALASDNFVRKELSDYERFKHAKLLKDHAFCKTNSEIGQVLGVSRQLVGFLFGFEDFPAGAKAILEVNPKILGATQANELKDIAREEPDVFTEAIALLAEDKIRQNQIRSWIESKFKSSSVRMQRRQEIKISRPGLRSPIKLTYTDREAKIQADGLDVGRLKKLIEDNLDSLITQ